MTEEEMFDAILIAHERWICMAQYEIMQMLGKLGYPCETWEEAEEALDWLLGDPHDDRDWRPSDDSR